MITKFVEAFDARREELREVFRESPPNSYSEIVRAVGERCKPTGALETSNLPDPARVHEIDDGDYQGTLVYVIGAYGYQPSTYWFVMIGYGSCSGCDALQAARYCGDDEERTNEIMTLAVHVLQGMREMKDDGS